MVYGCDNMHNIRKAFYKAMQKVSYISMIIAIRRNEWRIK